MATKFSNNSLSLVSYKNLNHGALRAVLVMLLFTFSIGQAWANHYYTDFKAISGAAGKGYVYAGTSRNDKPAYIETSDDINPSEPGSGKPTTYYAWAKAVRGADFESWALSYATLTTNNGGTADVITVVAPTSKGTTTGVATANWTTYTKVNVTYNPSEDGKYSVTYQYNSYDATTKEITTGDAENLSRTITSENGAQTIGSYKNDVITLKSTSGTFQGWYSDAGFTSPLSTDNPYTYTAPTSGSAAVYPKYEHVDRYYGRLTASIAAVPYSMPGGGTIFISKEEVGTGTYSTDAQTVDNVGMGTTGLKYYLHAQPTDKRYVFRGWYSNPECTGTALSTSAEYTYTFTATSMNSASPTLGNVYAAFDFNLFYMQVELEPAVPGLGMVLVKDNNTGTPDYTAYASHAEQFLYAYRLAPTANAYLYAKPKYGYKFSGWYDNPDCTGTAKSTANPYTYTATGSSTDPMNPTIIKLYAKFVEDDNKVNITYNIPDKTKGEYTASVLDIAEVNDEFVWTFTEVYNSADYTANTTLSQNKTDVLRLEAQLNAGYGVTSWTIAGTAKTTPSHLYETTATAAATYGVTFGDAKPFLVSRNSTSYSDFQEAITAANGSGTITVVQNAYVPAGNYTLSGVALYVPRAEGSTAKGTLVERSQAAVTAPTPYVTLTLANGVHITTNTSIEVGAQIVGTAQDNSSASAGCNGAISGTYGRIVMNEGSTIILNSGAKLYAWGQVIGSGRVTANSGATVYEIFQVTDWCGGSRAYACNAGKSQYKMFPFSQYHVQNIEAPLRIKNGASEKLMAVIDGNNADDIPLIGPDNSSSMFRTNSSDAYVEKSYDKVNDRQVYRVNGTASITDFSLRVVIDVSTESFILPLTNNMTIYVESGKTTLGTNAIVNADTRVFVNEGATVEVGNSLYVYDSDDWLSGFVFNGKKIAPIRYSLPYATTTGTSSGTPIRTNEKIQDASILVNGTLDIKGSLYTSSGNANIYSTATGVVKFSSAAPSTNTTVYHLNTISGSNFFASVATTYNTTMYPAKLRNGDGTFVATAGAAKNDQFIYSKTQGRWLKNPKTISWDANGGESEASTLAYSEGDFLGELPAAYKDGYTLEGWYTAADGGTQIDATTKVTANATYYAHWTPKSYTITYRDQGGTAFSGTHVDSPTEHPTTHTFGTATTLNNATKSGYDFGGWYRTPSCSGAQVTTIAETECKNITLYAKWTPIAYAIYDLTIMATPAGYGSVSHTSISDITGGTSVTSGSNTFTVGSTTVTATPTANNEQYTYAFDHWENLPATVTEDVSIQAVFTRTTNKYTITWVDGNGSTLKTEQVEYGTTPAYAGATPTKTATAQYTYTFNETWSPAILSVTEDATYTAQFNNTVNKYTVTWLDGDGNTLKAEQIEYGQTPVYSGETPTKAYNFDYTYAFNSTWAPAITTVTEAATYTAQFDATQIPNRTLDIVEWTANTVTINVTSLKTNANNANWKVYLMEKTGKNDYTRTDCSSARTLTITDLSLAADNDLKFILKGNDGSVEGHYLCKIPHLYTADATLSGTTTESIVYVYGGKLTISGSTTLAALYVCPGAEVEVTDGKTLTVGKLVLRTKPWETAAISGDVSATNVYYTRIAPDGSAEYAVGKYYQFGLPYNCEINDVRLSDGTTPAYNTTWILKSYNEKRRATNGANGANWDAIASTGAIEAGVGYEMFSSSNYYREYYFPVRLNPATTSVGVSYTADGAAGSAHAGWNIVCSPLMSVFQNAPAPEGITICLLRPDGNYDQVNPSVIMPAVPFSYQAPEAGTLTFGASLTFTPTVSPAPRRRVTAAEEPTRIQWIHLDILNADGEGDQTSIYSHPTRYEQTYKTGVDVAKQSLTASRAIIYSSHAYGDMAFAGVADTLLESGVALTVYSPATQELTFSLRDNDWLNRMEYVWLIDKETGTKIDLLSSDYSYEAAEGTTRGRFFIQGQFKAPNITTELEPTSDSSLKGREIRKLIINQKMFIEVNGRWYDATGKEVKR